MPQPVTRRKFISSAAVLLTTASFSSGCSLHKGNISSTNQYKKTYSPWENLPEREHTLDFPEFTSYEPFSEHSVSELVSEVKQRRPKDMWLADLHALATKETLKNCFDEELTIENVDSIKKDIDSLAKLISGEIVYQNDIQGRELSLREQATIINRAFYGKDQGRFQFVDPLGDKLEDRVGFENRLHSNRLFDEVWSNRLGVCEDLVSAYMCIVDRLNQAGHDLNLKAVMVPGHILIQATEEDKPFFIELTEHGKLYELSEVLGNYQISGKPHLVSGFLSSLACSISNTGSAHHIQQGPDRGKITDKDKAQNWIDSMRTAVSCAPNDIFYRVKLVDQIVKHGYQLEDADFEKQILKILNPVSKDFPKHRAPAVLLARFYASELGRAKNDKAIRLLRSALKKPELGEGDARSVTLFVKTSNRYIKSVLRDLQSSSYVSSNL